MGKPIVILADSDENYLSPLEVKFLEKLNDDIELEIITDSSYFNNHFSTPQSAEILVVNEQFYTSDLQKQNISNIYVLSESPDEGETEDLGVTKIFKYTNTQEIYNQIIATSKGFIHSQTNKTKETSVVVFYSAAGGVGKTTLSMSMCACLNKNFKKVLYINAQRINSFQFYLDNAATAPNSIYTELANTDLTVFSRIKHIIRNEGFDYLPPFSAALSSLNMNFSIYEDLIKSAKSTKEYDVIVVDTDTTFDVAKASLIADADKVVIITTQSKASVNATNMLLKNMSCSDHEKYLFLCNKFDVNAFNALNDTNCKANFTVNEYVKCVENIDEMKLNDILNNADMQKLSFLAI